MLEMDAEEEEQITPVDRTEGSVLVNVSHLEIPTELAVIIQSLNGTLTLLLYQILYCYCCLGWKNANWVNGLRLVKENIIDVQATLQELPDDVDSCTFAKFASTYYQASDQLHIIKIFSCSILQEGYDFVVALEPLPSSLLRMKSPKDISTAVDMFKMVMRFMGDDGLTGIKERVLGNYIIHKVLNKMQSKLIVIIGLGFIQ